MSIIFKIPLVIYENNLVIGRSNRYLLPLAKKLFSACDKLNNFPKKYENKFFYSGHILREEMLNYKN